MTNETYIQEVKEAVEGGEELNSNRSKNENKKTITKEKDKMGHSRRVGEHPGNIPVPRRRKPESIEI